ncbi:MAG: homoserine dehydrogenase [Endozoicomonadaceae bacterium]|nr:homoserine dehydrogenase [Endozoicomonadaceae bacterium]
MKPVRVGICGLGTVGSGTVNVLVRNRKIIARRLGRSVDIVQIGARRDHSTCDTTDIDVTQDIFDVANNPKVDILVELIGGYETAKSLILTAIANGKHIVTANKALIAQHGNEIFAAAREQCVIVAYEAGVAGGIPAIKILREGLVANRIQWLAGIINGTSNFILTEMHDKGSSFNDALKLAQKMGYAESVPTFDIEGTDSAHKLTILAANAFGIPLQFDNVYIEGIRAITPQDIQYASELGYRIKHLGIARFSDEGVELRVHPTLVPEKHLLASVDGVMNAVLIEADVTGQTLYYGPGAGSEATASAVIADIIDVARLQQSPASAVPPLGFVETDSRTTILPVTKICCSYYLRLHVSDHPGVLARITEVLSHNGFNINALIQKEARKGDDYADIVVLIHDVCEAVLDVAMVELENLDDVMGSIIRVRVDPLNH